MVVQRSKPRSPFHGLSRTAPRVLRGERFVATATKRLSVMRLFFGRSG